MFRAEPYFVDIDPPQRMRRYCNLVFQETLISCRTSNNSLLYSVHKILHLACSARINGGTGGFPLTAAVSPRQCSCSRNFLASLRGTVFVPGSAGALHTSQISSSTSTSHMTHLMLSNFLSSSMSIITLVALLITVTRDSDIAKTVLFWSCYFFRALIFRHPWADFRETLPHDAVCSEIVYLL